MNQSVTVVVRDQRRRRRSAFWLGFAALAIAGFAWAGLTREPLNGFGDQVFDERGGVFLDAPRAFPEPAFVEQEAIPVPAPPVIISPTLPPLGD